MRGEKLSDIRILVTGGAGVIGSSLVRQTPGHITVVDNLSSSSYDSIRDLVESRKVEFVKGDVRNLELVNKAVKDKDLVIHLAASADVRYYEGKDTDEDLMTNAIGTYNVLESMRKNDVGKLMFSSSSSVYGYANQIPTPETYGPLIPESLYAASKLASEALIMSFSNMFDQKAWIFRFANIVAPRFRSIGRNVIPDLIMKLRDNPNKLQVLGDGTQEKSYLYVDDCIEGMFYLSDKSKNERDIFNLGNRDSITVHSIAKVIVEEMGLEKVEFRYTGGKSGWRGDVPKTILDISKASALGWSPKMDSEGSVRKSAKMIIKRLREK